MKFAHAKSRNPGGIEFNRISNDFSKCNRFGACGIKRRPCGSGGELVSRLMKPSAGSKRSTFTGRRVLSEMAAPNGTGTWLNPVGLLQFDPDLLKPALVDIG